MAKKKKKNLGVIEEYSDILVADISESSAASENIETTETTDSASVIETVETRAVTSRISDIFAEAKMQAGELLNDISDEVSPVSEDSLEKIENEFAHGAKEAELQEVFAEEHLESELDAALDSRTGENLDLVSELETAEGLDFESESSVFLTEDQTEPAGFLPEATESEDSEHGPEHSEFSAEGTELDGFESAEIEELEFVEEERLESIVESVLFASDRPVSFASLKALFVGTNIKSDRIRRALEQLSIEYAGGRRGVTLEEVPGGYQLRTKIDNLQFLRRTLKTRQFKLSGPALEVLSIVAYKQPIVKNEVDEIRGVESGHLLRALMEKSLVAFEGKSDLPGRPMQYGTTKKFLEIFGLRNLKELPTLSQIDELLPEGIDEQIAEVKPTLSALTDSLSEGTIAVSYSSGEEELMKISSQLEEISTSSTFFDEEKRRQAEKRDQERAQNIREALAMGEPVSTRDANWLKKFDEALAAGTTLVALKDAEQAAKKAEFMKKTVGDQDENSSTEVQDEGGISEINSDQSIMQDDRLQQAIEAFDNDEDVDQASDDQISTKDDQVEGQDHEDELHDEDQIDSYADSEEHLEASAEEDDEELPFYGEADEIDEEGLS